MKIGFTIREDRQTFLEEHCERVVYVPLEEQTSTGFYTFVKKNLDCDLYIEKIADIGLQMIQLAKVLDLLRSKKKIIYFLDQEDRGGMSAITYFNYLVKLVNNERYLTTYRTYRGQEEKNDKETESPAYKSHSSYLCEEIDYFSADYEKEERERRTRKQERLYGAPLGMIPKYEQTVR